MKKVTFECPASLLMEMLGGALKAGIPWKKVTEVISHVLKQPTKCFTIHDSKQPTVATASVGSFPEYSAETIAAPHAHGPPTSVKRQVSTSLQKKK